jgi:hypothetical protein
MLTSYIDSLPPPPRKVATTEAASGLFLRTGLAVAAITAGIVWSWQTHSAVGSAVFALVGCAMAVSLASSYRREQALARNGVGTIATISTARTVGGGCYMVWYTFRIGDRAYHSRSVVAFGDYVPAVGETLAILYDPDAPAARSAALAGLTLVAPE